ncbi:MAG TPA: ribosome recycling factor [Cyclobacteriaceae bacterium]|jgi:ribosome recycling factor|nr:ribosome recycling factor [Cytophagales bacterium]HMR56143.1 ribosome recycling factor [Cyclobacteriaceae bacterium]HNT49181.1 ribosome recycling factor [Cyclobacteriaceae bacterium]HRE67404.1 ribosome recycling factor [Cyclobacteriaceae bacterium]HRF33427.1 ribosome recycling factor [Cyclobacteriaceae bacterium]
MEEIELYLDEAQEQMGKSLLHVGNELVKIRAGKANPNMLDGIQVSYYGAMSPLNQVASVTAPEARTLFIKPWEKSLIQEIEKAIMIANLGLTPQNDGQQVIINIPMLTEERRKQLVRQASQECEQGKVSIRSIRKDTNEQLKKIKGASEDDVKNAEETVQKLTNEFIEKIDALMKKKEAEIMTV